MKNITILLITFFVILTIQLNAQSPCVVRPDVLLSPFDIQTDASLLSGNYDVIIVGAGTGGVSAAVQAAQMGVKVALLEETDWIGGQMNAAGVTSMDELYPYMTSNRQSGFYRKFINKITAYYPGNLSQACYWNGMNISFEPNIGQNMLCNLIKEARDLTSSTILHLSLYTTVESVVMAGNTVKGIKVKINKDNTAEFKEISCKVLIDATECGDVIPLTPARYMIGNYITSQRKDIRPDVYMQDITYLAVIKKYSTPTLQLTEIPNPDSTYFKNRVPYSNEFPNFLKYDFIKTKFANVFSNDGDHWVGQSANHHWDWYVHNAYRGMPDSDNPDCDITSDSKQFKKITKTGINWVNDYPTMSPYPTITQGGPPRPKLSVKYLEDMEFRKQANGEAKLKTLQFLYYLQHDKTDGNLWSVDTTIGYNTPYSRSNLCDTLIIPRSFDSVQQYFPPIAYVRESRRIVGIHTLTGHELKRYKDKLIHPGFKSSLAIGNYFMDLHNTIDITDYEEYSGDAQVSDTLKGKGNFQVPFECFIPEKTDGFLAAEKNISVSRLVNGATRLQPVTMATGQAAGAIAARSVLMGLQPRYVDPIIVQKDLVDDTCKISLYSYKDVPMFDTDRQVPPYWPYIEIASANQLLAGYGDGYFGVNDPLLRKHAAEVIVRAFLSNAPLTYTTSSFPDDISIDFPQFQYIERLHSKGIIPGCSNTKFYPDKDITFAEFSVFLAKAMQLNTDIISDTIYFKYNKPVPERAIPYIQVLADRRINIDDNSAIPQTINPNAAISRGEATKWLVKALLYQSRNNEN